MPRYVSPGLSVVETAFLHRFSKRFFTYLPLKEGKCHMTQDIQDTLLQLFESVRHDPESLPSVSLEGWQEGSAES